MIATTFKQRLGRILAFVLAMLPGLAWPATDFDCQGESTFSFAASQHDFAPGRACVVKLSTGEASLSITGFTGGAPGRIVMVENAGSTAFSLADASTSSSVGNRFQFPANITLPAGATIFLRYDAGTREWKAVSAPASEDAAFADDVAITGDLTVTGAAALNGATTFGGTIVSPVIFSSAARVYHGTKTLTEAGAAETILTVTNATTQATSGTLYYHIKGTDATDYQSTVGTLIFTAVNKGGTVTSSFLPATIADGITQESATQALSSGTMTGAFDSTEAANATAISIDIDSSLTLTTITMEWVLILQGPGTIS